MVKLLTLIKDVDSKLKSSSKRHNVHYLVVYGGILVLIYTIFVGIFVNIMYVWNIFYPPVHITFENNIETIEQYIEHLLNSIEHFLY